MDSSGNEYLAAKPEFSSPRCIPQKPVYVALLHRPRMPPEEEHDKPVLNILYLENTEKGNHKAELTWWHTLAHTHTLE